MTALSELGAEIQDNAIAKGFKARGEKRNFGEIIALIHSELSEALEEFRDGRAMNEIYYHCPAHGDVGINVKLSADIAYCEKCTQVCKPEGIPIEFADAIIRILDSCAENSINIDVAVQWKMAYNTTRSFKHGKTI